MSSSERQKQQNDKKNGTMVGMFRPIPTGAHSNDEGKLCACGAGDRADDGDHVLGCGREGSHASEWERFQ